MGHVEMMTPATGMKLHAAPSLLQLPAGTNSYGGTPVKGGVVIPRGVCNMGGVQYGGCEIWWVCNMHAEGRVQVDSEGEPGRTVGCAGG